MPDLSLEDAIQALSGGDGVMPPPPNPMDPNTMPPYLRGPAHFGAGAVHGLLDLPRRAFEQSERLRAGFDYDPSPVMQSILGASTAQMPVAPSGSLGVFGGRLAETANKTKLLKAQDMELEGEKRIAKEVGTGKYFNTVKAENDLREALNDKIWDETGWNRFPDMKWKFEIPDFDSTLFGQANRDLESGLEKVRLPEYMHHPELYDAYPFLRKTEITGKVYPGSGGTAWSKELLGIPPEYSSDIRRSNLLHELDHGVQMHENFAPGANFTQNIGQARMLAGNKLPKGTYFDELPKEVQELINNLGMTAYRRHGGEVSARNVQQRSNWAPEDAAMTSPYASMDVPRHEQIHPHGWLSQQPSYIREMMQWLNRDPKFDPLNVQSPSPKGWGEAG